MSLPTHEMRPRVPLSHAEGAAQGQPRGPLVSTSTRGDDAKWISVKSPLLNFQGHSCFQTPQELPGASPRTAASERPQFWLPGWCSGRITGRGDQWVAPDACPRPGPTGIHSVARLCPSRAPVGESAASAPVTLLHACDTLSRHESAVCLLRWGTSPSRG